MHCNVIVVGAGFAGLVAAASLRGRHGVVVLEARAHAGGRARTVHLSEDLDAELGATWLHGLGIGEDVNPVLTAAVQAGAISSRPQRQQWWAPRFLLPGQARALSPEEELVVHKAVQAFGAAVETLQPGAGGSVGDAADAAWRALLDGGGVDGERVPLAAAAWRWREMLQRAMDGYDSSHAASAAARARYSEYAGHEAHAAIPGGYQSVARHLAADLDVRYGHEVQHVQWGADGVHVVCANGASFHADAAIITLPLGVLKEQHAAMFSPPLPASKAGAIQRLRAGVVDKVFVDFAPVAESRTNHAGEGGDTVPAPQDVDVATFALLWDASRGAERDSDAEPPLPAWTRGIFSVRFGGPEFKRRSAIVNVDEAAGTLEEELHDEGGITPAWQGETKHQQAVVWLAGADALAMESASDDEVLVALRGVFERFPGIKLPAGAAWERARLTRSCWGTDPFARGSYSYVAADSEVDNVEALFAPLKVAVAAADGAPAKTVLAFAGEACSLRYIGTTHGAFLSGQAQALALLEEHPEWRGRS